MKLNKVNYKQFGMTVDERRQLHADICGLRQYIISLKERDLGGLKCEACGIIDKPLDIHHKRYATDVNYHDLILLCEECHTKLQPSRYDN